MSRGNRGWWDLWGGVTHSAHLLLHDGHRGPCQQEGLERPQVPEAVPRLVVAGDDIGPGLVVCAEEDRPGGTGPWLGTGANKAGKGLPRSLLVTNSTRLGAPSQPEEKAK